MSPTHVKNTLRRISTATVSDTLRASQHAREVMHDRLISWADVVDTVRNANVTEPHKGMTRYSRNGLCVVVGVDGCTVVTVLLRATQDRWTNADARNRAAS